MHRRVTLPTTLLAASLAAACVAPSSPISQPAQGSPVVDGMVSPVIEPMRPPSLSILPISPPLDLSPKDRICLVAAMYYEAHGEGEDGMLAVGHVVINRQLERPAGTSICDVVYERGQFGWTRRVSRKRIAIGRTQSWKTAAALADKLAAGGLDDITAGATSFYSVLEFRKGPPHWAAVQQETARIGNHVFIVP